ncbi:metallophosphoesterase family protein [Anaerosalibacter sp. Marseille-P3206]|uniref:metallophosphoesterase family protein n=1 Tax=Anaerosalibacter sp. Marseille-P3206 TaxID=1871005 RepID=UPI000987D14A|nr:metallophosphoesterase [Anaerosalibacter sp. Marseille-P3206]
MRIFVVSDTHGRINEFVRYAKKLEKPDLIIHLGDNVEDAYQIEKEMKVDTVVIRGNCDFVSNDIESEKLLKIKDKNIFITHGNKYNVKYDLTRLLYKAEEVEADMVLFGHTHIPFIESEKYGIIVMNPGSPTLPRGSSDYSFGIIDIGEKIKAKVIEF